MHEAEGAGRRAFAVWQAVRHDGPVFWVLYDHQPVRPFLWGLPPALGPRLHLASVRSEVDLLWVVEEILRAGCAGLVIAEPDRPLSLTAGRRLQLAAEKGQTTGLMLIQEGRGSNASETRWQCAPRARETGAWQDWRRVKDKRGATGEWLVDWADL